MDVRGQKLLLGDELGIELDLAEGVFQLDEVRVGGGVGVHQERLDGVVCVET